MIRTGHYGILDCRGKIISILPEQNGIKNKLHFVTEEKKQSIAELVIFYIQPSGLKKSIKKIQLQLNPNATSSDIYITADIKNNIFNYTVSWQGNSTSGHIKTNIKTSNAQKHARSTARNKTSQNDNKLPFIYILVPAIILIAIAVYIAMPEDKENIEVRKLLPAKTTSQKSIKKKQKVNPRTTYSKKKSPKRITHNTDKYTALSSTADKPASETSKHTDKRPIVSKKKEKHPTSSHTPIKKDIQQTTTSDYTTSEPAERADAEAGFFWDGSDTVYIAVEGDTIRKVSLRYFKDEYHVWHIANLNNIKDPDHIEPGTQIKVTK
jgi:hypothetical protein